uniref:Uncharacterized protein n=1 Tax=Rhizophora mucronata TaxID=61149 RepID=A0A2P2R0K5_RHIMU
MFLHGYLFSEVKKRNLFYLVILF